MTKYVIRSGLNTFVPDTTNWEASVWTTDLEEAKVFKSLDEAVEALGKVADYFREMGWAGDQHTIYEVHEVKSLSLSSPVHIDDKETVLRLLQAIKQFSVNPHDIPDMDRIIFYVKAKGT